MSYSPKRQEEGRPERVTASLGLTPKDEAILAVDLMGS